MGKDKARHSVGERRLADALRAPDQPGVRNAPASICVQQGCFLIAMTEQDGRLTRMRNGDLRFNLTRAHAELATLPKSFARKRSCNADQMFAATMSDSALASIKRHRCGSAAAIRR